MKEYMQVVSEFGLTMNLQKTKVMVTGQTATEEEKVPLNVGEDGVVEYVSEFTYLGSGITVRQSFFRGGQKDHAGLKSTWFSTENSVC